MWQKNVFIVQNPPFPWEFVHLFQPTWGTRRCKSEIRWDFRTNKMFCIYFRTRCLKRPTYLFMSVPKAVCVAGTFSLRRLGMPRYDVWLWHLHAGPPSHLSCIYFCPGRLKLRRRRLQRWALKPSPPRDLWLIGVPKMISKRASERASDASGGVSSAAKPKSKQSDSRTERTDAERELARDRLVARMPVV